MSPKIYFLAEKIVNVYDKIINCRRMRCRRIFYIGF